MKIKLFIDQFQIIKNRSEDAWIKKIPVLSWNDIVIEAKLEFGDEGGITQITNYDIKVKKCPLCENFENVRETTGFVSGIKAGLEWMVSASQTVLAQPGNAFYYY